MTFPRYPMPIAPSRLLLGLLAMVLASTLLVACGGSSNSDGTTSTPSSTVSGPLQDCGRVTSRGDQAVESTALTSENCLYQAFSQCKNGTLAFVQGGIDTATVHTLKVATSNGKCAVTDDVQVSGPGVVSTPQVEHDVCTTVTQSTNGLTISDCDNEDNYTIPAQSAS